MKHKLTIVNGLGKRDCLKKIYGEHLPIDQQKDDIALQSYWRNTEFALRYIQE